MKRTHATQPILRAAVCLLGMLAVMPAPAERFEPSTYKIYVRDWCHGPCIVIEGGMNRGIAAAFEKVADQNPHIDKVWLWSGGGWVKSGFHLYRAIKKRGMDTVAKSCQSACMTAFMGGERRVLVPGSWGLGFHQVNTDFGVDHYTRRSQNRTRYMFKKRGVEKWFLKKMYQARPQGMWYPSGDELLDAGVITHLADADGNLRDRDGNFIHRDSVQQ